MLRLWPTEYGLNFVISVGCIVFVLFKEKKDLCCYGPDVIDLCSHGLDIVYFCCYDDCLAAMVADRCCYGDGH